MAVQPWSALLHNLSLVGASSHFFEDDEAFTGKDNMEMVDNLNTFNGSNKFNYWASAYANSVRGNSLLTPDGIKFLQ